MTSPRDTTLDMASKRKAEPEENRARPRQIFIRVDEEEHEHMRAVAKAHGLDLATWARLVLRKAAGMLTP